MKIKRNKNGTISITGMNQNLYEAISKIVCCAEHNFILHGGEYIAIGELKCGITIEEKKELEKEYWVI